MAASSRRGDELLPCPGLEPGRKFFELDGFDFPWIPRDGGDFPIHSVIRTKKASVACGRREHSAGKPPQPSPEPVQGIPRSESFHPLSGSFKTPRRDRPHPYPEAGLPDFLPNLPPVPRGCFESLLRAACPSRIGRNLWEERSPALHPWSIHSGIRSGK